MKFAALALGFVPLAPLAAQANVWVVAPAAGPGVDFTALQPAVDAAVSGDVVLVRPGTYTEGCVVSGKAVSLVADVADDQAQRPVVETSAPLVVEGTPPGLTTTVRGLELRGTFSPVFANQSAVRVTNCQGGVCLENCALSQLPPSQTFGFAPVLTEAACEAATSPGGLVLSRCTLVGAQGVDGTSTLPGDTSAGTPGLELVDTTVHTSECEITGGRGGNGILPQPFGAPGTEGSDGAPAVLASGGALSLAATAVTGGDGGFGAGTGGAGGDCVFGTGVVLTLQEVAFTFGLGGTGATAPGADGGLIDPAITGIVDLGPAARRYRFDAPRRVGETPDATFTGQPGDLAFLFAGARLLPTSVLAQSLPLGLALPFQVTTISAVIPAGGTVAVPVTLPTIGGEEVRTSYGQALFVATDGGFHVSSVSAAVILDPAF